MTPYYGSIFNIIYRNIGCGAYFRVSGINKNTAKTSLKQAIGRKGYNRVEALYTHYDDLAHSLKGNLSEHTNDDKIKQMYIP